MEDPPPHEIAQRQRNMLGIGTDAFLIVFAGNVAAACGIENVIGTVSGLDDESLVRLVIGHCRFGKRLGTLPRHCASAQKRKREV
jgi:hypothetical protein